MIRSPCFVGMPALGMAERGSEGRTRNSRRTVRALADRPCSWRQWPERLSPSTVPRRLRAAAAERRAFLRERHLGDDWKGKRNDGVDRGDQLLDVAECLQHEEIDAALLESASLLLEYGHDLSAAELAYLAEMPSGPMDPAISTSCERRRGLAGQLHATMIEFDDAVGEPRFPSL